MQRQVYEVHWAGSLSNPIPRRERGSSEGEGRELWEQRIKREDKAVEEEEEEEEVVVEEGHGSWLRYERATSCRHRSGTSQGHAGPVLDGIPLTTYDLYGSCCLTCCINPRIAASALSLPRPLSSCRTANRGDTHVFSAVPLPPCPSQAKVPYAEMTSRNAARWLTFLLSKLRGKRGRSSHLCTALNLDLQPRTPAASSDGRSIRTEVLLDGGDRAYSQRIVHIRARRRSISGPLEVDVLQGCSSITLVGRSKE